MTRTALYRLGAAFFLALAALLAVALPPRDSSAAGPTADEIGKRVQQFYDATKTFQATFTQTYTIKVQNVKKVSTGKVIFEKPGKMSWTYDAPNGNR
ncbi:MAG: outer membrane lipoprotein carrier protein LolA, partial [Polyangiaceae bacterium]|nr:outer membrane lipoprotein carrier protein LolA [Polyangiaceae bacterium]